MLVGKAIGQNDLNKISIFLLEIADLPIDSKYLNL